jgi:hypothetical protein
MLIIATSGKKGRCYIETKNLDGETNKKVRKMEQKLMFKLLGYNEQRVIGILYLVIIQG